MDVIIQSLGFKAGDSLENFIHEKLNKLNHDNIVRANVVLYKGPDSNPEGDYCEIRLEIPGNDPFVKKNSPYFETSVSECVDVLEEILNRAKSKQMDRRQAAAATIHDVLNGGSAE